MQCQFFLCLSGQFEREKPVFWKASFLQNKDLITHSNLCVQDFVTGKNFSFNQSLEQKSFAFFLGKVILEKQ